MAEKAIPDHQEITRHQALLEITFTAPNITIRKSKFSFKLAFIAEEVFFLLTYYFETHQQQLAYFQNPISKKIYLILSPIGLQYPSWKGARETFWRKTMERKPFKSIFTLIIDSWVRNQKFLGPKKH